MNDPPEVRQPRGFPSPWARSDRPVARRIVRPLEQFVSQEAGSGLVLMIAAIAALVWANVAPDSYNDFWHTETVASVGALDLHLDLLEVVNDGLMAISSTSSPWRSSVSSSSAPCATAATRRCRSPPRSGPWWVPRSPTRRSTSSATATWMAGRSRSPPTSPSP